MFSSCECESFDDDVKILCGYASVVCNSDNSTCYTGTIEQILTEDTDIPVGTNETTFLQRVVTACTQFTTDDNESETCVRVFPVEDGDFTSLDSCSVLYSPDGSEPKLCASCTVEDPTCTGESGFPEISWDCCNLQTDQKQTCGPVSQGVAIPYFDVIPENKKGMCTSGAPAASGLTHSLFGAMASVALFYWLF